MIAAQGFAKLDTVQGRQGLTSRDTISQRDPDRHDLTADAGRDMGDPVGAGLHLAGGADGAGQPLFFCGGNNDTVLLLHLGGHRNPAFFPMLVVTRMAVFFSLMTVFFMVADLFLRMSDLLFFRLLAATACQ